MMARFIDFATRAPVLIGSGVLVVILGACFLPVMMVAGAPMLDLIADPEQGRARLAAMPDGARLIHLIATATLDTLYPATLVTFFGGLAARFQKGWGAMIVLPALAAGALDLIENALQIVMLAGGPDLFTVKAAVTPLKFQAYLLAASVAVAAIVIALIGAVIKRTRRP
jgi:hypothetical protein